MHFKIKKKIEQYLTFASDEVSLIYDDGVNAIEVKRNEMKNFTEKLAKEIEILSSEKELGDVVAVAFDSNSKNVLNVCPSIFAVLLLKKGFFVIDPKCQAWSWIESAVQDLGIKSILCDDNFILELRQNTKIKLTNVTKVTGICLEANILFLDNSTEQPLIPFSDLVYVVQTSGTSGQRKTVFVSEQSILPNVEDFDIIFRLEKTDKIFSAAPPTFDPFCVDLFLFLCKECPLVFVPLSIKSQNVRLSKILFDRQKVTYLQITPTLYKSISNYLEVILRSDINFVKYLVLGGELFPEISPNILLETSTKVFNVYGVTEMSCWQTLTQVPSKDLLKQSKHQELLLKEPHFQDQPLQIYPQPIFNVFNGSSQLLRQTEIDIIKKTGETFSSNTSNFSEFEGEIVLTTQSRFCHVVTNFLQLQTQQLIDNKYVVHTKDLARVTASGDVILTGRSDDVIKIQGKRTSPAEIETAMKTLLNKQCICINIDNKVVAFLVSNDDDCQSFQEVKNLPSHLVPQNITTISSLPMTSNGKVDKQFLINLHKKSFTIQKRKAVGNRGTDLLSDLWKQYLGALPLEGQLFIEAGGDSHLAVLLVQQFQDLTGQYDSNLLDILLNNKFSEVQNYIEMKENKTTPTTEGTTTIAPIKKPKLSLNENVAQSLSDDQVEFASRGKSFCTGTMSQDFSCLDFFWKIDLSKCIDATPLVVRSKQGEISTISATPASPPTKASTVTSSESCTVFVGSHKGIFIAVDLNSGLELWRRNLPDRIEASAAVSSCGKYVFVGCYDGLMYCLRSQDGAIHWSFTTFGMIKSLPCVTVIKNFPRAYSTCKIAQRFPSSNVDCIIFGSYDKSVYAISIESGEQIFKTKLTASICTSPVIVDDCRILVTTLSGQCSILDLQTGAILLDVNLQAPIFSTPVIAGQLAIIVTVKGSIHALDLTQNFSSKWTLQIGSPVFSSISLLNIFHPTKSTSEQNDSNKNVFNLLNSNENSVNQASSNKNILSEEYFSDKNLSAEFTRGGETENTDFSAKDSSAEDSSKVDALQTGGVLNQDILFGCHDSHTYCVQSTDGKLKWKNRHTSPVFATPCPFKTSTQDFVASLSTDGLFKLIRGSSGQTGFETRLTGPTDLENRLNYFSSPVIVDEKVIVGCRDNCFYCFKLK